MAPYRHSAVVRTRRLTEACVNGLGQIWNEQTKLMTYITLWYLGNVYCEYYAQMRSKGPKSLGHIIPTEMALSCYLADHRG